jgi:thiamine kinase-like enzyme
MDELHDILPGLQRKLGALSGTPEPLDGGITNRNFRATLGGVEYVIRRPGKDTDLLGIDRDAERTANEAASALGIAPAVAATLEDCLVTRFLTCSPIDAAGLQEGVEELALALRAFHDSGVPLPTRFWVPDLLEDYAVIVASRGGSLPDGYQAARRAAALIQEALPLTEPRPCHNDLLPGNIICAGGRLMIVDWEYAGMGDPRFDLGNLSVNNSFDATMDERLLTAYGGRPPSDASRAALNLMRVLSDAREGAWAVVQGRVSALDFDFDAYGREHFERLQAAVEQESFADWLSAAGK